MFALKLLIFFSFAGFCLRYCTILRLLFLLHDPTGSALLVLLCRPAAGGENHPGKGRGRRTYRKCPHSDLVGFQMLSSRHFFPFGENIMSPWRPLHPLPQSRHFFFGLPVRGVWMCTFSCIPSDYALTSDRQWPHKQDFIAISHPIKRSKSWLNASQQVKEFVINETDRWCNVVSQGDNVQNNWKSPEQARGRRQGCWGCRSRSLVVQTHPWVAFWRASSSSSSANSFPPHSGQSYSQEERGCGGDEGRE